MKNILWSECQRVGFWVSTFLIWVFGPKLIPPNNQSSATLWRQDYGSCPFRWDAWVVSELEDKDRAPIAADLKRTKREKSKVDELTFALSADVTEVHRQVPIHPDDWHLLGCQVIPGGDVFVNTVGTFGVASASYYWSRVAAAVGRLAQYLAGYSCTTWHMLVADDYLLECGDHVRRRCARA